MKTNGEATPVIECRYEILGGVHADSSIEPWPFLAPVPMVETVSGGSPVQSTSFKCAWDDAGFRVLYVAVDSNPWATLRQRDEPLYTEEVVEVFIDPVGDLASYFEIEVNPLNAVLDLVLRRNRSGYLKDFAWNCRGLESAVQITSAGWCAELSIPFEALGIVKSPAGQCWRANFFRIDRPTAAEVEYSAWSPTGIPLFHVPERFGLVRFCARDAI